MGKTVIRTKRPKLLVATTNQGKLKELSFLLSGSPFTIVSLSDIGIDVEVAETGTSLDENASLKASTYFRMSGMATLADDSGLEVDALGGEPGYLSARYAGENATDAQRITYLLKKLDGTPEKEWGACFRCVLAIAKLDKPLELYRGECFGKIINKPKGVNGFGYDPVFWVTELGKTMAELSEDEKNRFSHRGRAAKKLLTALNQTIDFGGKTNQVKH